MKVRAWVLLAVVIVAWRLFVGATEAAAGSCHPVSCKAEASGDACLHDALGDLFADETLSCVDVKVAAKEGAACKQDVPVELNGKATSKSRCEGRTLVFVLDKKDVGEGTLEVKIPSAFGNDKHFAGKAAVPATPSGPSDRTPADAGDAQTSNSGSGPEVVVAREGGTGEVLVPVDVPPRNQGANTIPDFDWRPNELADGGIDPDRCNDTVLGRKRSETSYYRDVCSSGGGAGPRLTGEGLSRVTLIDREPEGLKRKPTDAALFIVDENLAVREEAPAFVTEGEPVIVRFVVRKALACRMRAEADAANHYDGSTFRVGGQEGIEKIVPPGFIFTEAKGGTKKVYSCEKELLPLSGKQPGPPQYAPADGEYTTVDFRFGPFSNDEIVIHLRRKDRTLSQVDMEAELKIPNHKRYSGWFDVTLGANWLFAPPSAAEAVFQNGSPMRRLTTDNRRVEYDVAIILKAYATCFQGDKVFRPVDVKGATACLAVGGGLSIAHPLQTFYPFGLSLQLGQFLSGHAMLSLNRYKTLADGYQIGDVYSGNPEDLPTKDRYVLGMGFGFGVDPSLFGTLLKGLVVGK